MTSVLITGASKGLGRAAAHEFARRGYRVVATARDANTLDDLDVDQRLTLDVGDPDSVAAAVEQAGEIDVLVSNAGVIILAAVEATPIDELTRLFRTNTAGSVAVAQAVLPQMRRRGSGRLLFLSSVVGRTVLPGNAAYAATKWALEALVEQLAIEVGHFGISATLIEPGPISTGALDNITGYAIDGDPYAPLMNQRGITAADMLTPQEVAAVIADAAQAPNPALRVRVGEFTERLLTARDAAPFDRPFRAVPLDW